MWLLRPPQFVSVIQLDLSTCVPMICVQLCMHADFAVCVTIISRYGTVLASMHMCVFVCVCHCQETLLHYSLRDPKATQRSHSAVPYICGSLARLVLRCLARTRQDVARSNLSSAGIGCRRVSEMTLGSFH